eukprot:s2891_g14.t1
MSEKGASKQYAGDALRVAAQGILDKPDGGHRITHDATPPQQPNPIGLQIGEPWPQGAGYDHEAAPLVSPARHTGGGRDRWASIWKFIAGLEMIGAPFLYRKFRGGFTLDYVGYWLDHGRLQIGISERRTCWLIDFVDKLVILLADRWLVLTRRYQEFHGRLGFTARVRPLLAPGYAWLAAVGKATTVKVPELVAMVCIFIRSKLKSGLRKIPCSKGERQRVVQDGRQVQERKGGAGRLDHGRLREAI